MTAPMKCKCGEMPAWRYFPASSSERQFMCYSCGISGPYNDSDHVGWDGLAGGSAAKTPERKVIQIEATIRTWVEEVQTGFPRKVSRMIHTALANDGTMWLRNWDKDDGKWMQINPLPSPVEVKGEVS